MQKISIASDHNGVNLKDKIRQYLEVAKYEIVDFGPLDSVEAVDYPDYAQKLCESIIDGEVSIGVLVCGTGIGTVSYTHLRAHET